MDPKTLKNIIAQVDYSGDGQINYTEFLAAALPVDKLVTETMLT